MTRQNTGKYFLQLLILLLVFVQCGGWPAAKPRNRLNVVLITVDTLRADHLSCYGYEHEISPNIDKLAQEGVQFNACISQSPITPIAHSSILTGKNPYKHGVRSLLGDKPYILDSETPTLASLLRKVDYQTSAFISAMTLEKKKYGLDKGFDVYEQGFYKEGGFDFNQAMEEVNYSRAENPTQRRGELTTALACEWLHHNRDETFFLWIHYFDPHDTYLLPPQNPGVFTYSFKNPLKDIHTELYDIEIKYVDLLVGQLLDELSKIGIKDRTLLVLTSDHGQGLGDHGYWYHGQYLYQEQLHVPLIISGPGLPAGLQCDALVRSVDIVPTILDILDYPIEGKVCNFDGVSLEYLFKSAHCDKSSDGLVAYSETSYRKLLLKKSPLVSIIKGDVKLIYPIEEPDKCELYRLCEDKREEDNLFQKEPDLASEMMREADEMQKEAIVPLPRYSSEKVKDWENNLKSLALDSIGFSGRKKDEWEDKLKALGYLK